MSSIRPAGRRRRPVPLLAVPATAWYLLFFVVPIGFIAVYSLGYKPPITSGRGSIALDRLSFDNYGDALSGTLLTLFVNTMRVSVVGTLLCLLISFPLAYWLATRVPQPWKSILLGLLIVPFWISFLIRTIAWRIILAPNGFFSERLQDVGVLSEPLAVLDTRTAVQIGVVYNYLPLMVFPVFVALDRIDPALREASKDLGAGRARTFVQVTLPLAAPGVIAGCLLVFIPLSGDYITASVLGGAKGTMVGALVASQFLTAQNWALGSALSIVLIAAILAIIGVVALIGVGLRWVLRATRAPLELPVGGMR